MVVLRSKDGWGEGEGGGVSRSGVGWGIGRVGWGLFGAGWLWGMDDWSQALKIVVGAVAW